MSDDIKPGSIYVSPGGGDRVGVIDGPLPYARTVYLSTAALGCEGQPDTIQWDAAGIYLVGVRALEHILHDVRAGDSTYYADIWEALTHDPRIRDALEAMRP